jgi:hypothetical protein
MSQPINVELNKVFATVTEELVEKIVVGCRMQELFRISQVGARRFWRSRSPKFTRCMMHEMRLVLLVCVRCDEF